MIQVNDREISFTKGMTVADAIKEAGIAVDTMTLVVVDREIIPFEELTEKPLIDGAQIKLLTIISGG